MITYKQFLLLKEDPDNVYKPDENMLLQAGETDDIPFMKVGDVILYSTANQSQMLDGYNRPIHADLLLPFYSYPKSIDDLRLSLAQNKVETIPDDATDRDLANTFNIINKDTGEQVNSTWVRNHPQVEIVGRIWPNSKVISFWHAKDRIMKNFKSVEQLMQGLGQNSKGYRYEFIDIFDELDTAEHGEYDRGSILIPYNELNSYGNEPRLSPEEIAERQAKMHLAGGLGKKRTSSGGGSYKQSQIAQKAGFDSVAAMNAAGYAQ